MEAALSCSWLLRFCVGWSALLLPLCCHGAPFPLRLGWSFSADLSQASPLPQNAYTPLYTSLFTPVLPSSFFSSSKGFALGFYSSFPPTSDSPSSASIFLSVCLGTNATDSSGRAFAIPVWRWPPSPLRQRGSAGRISLRVEEGEGAGAGAGADLVLRDGDGGEAWRVRRAFAMEMRDDGNWVLYSSPNVVAWQSFDHPGDTLLQGQKLNLGMKMTSNNSLFTMEMHPGGLLVYMDSQAPSPLYYWGFPVNTSAMSDYVVTQFLNLSRAPSVNLTADFLSYACPLSDPPPYASLVGGNFTINGSCLSSQWPYYMSSLNTDTYPSDLLQLSDNGQLNGYTYLRTDGHENLLLSSQTDLDSCLPPNSCGPYGICIPNSFGVRDSCHCPSAKEDPRFSQVFSLIKPSDSSQGCLRSQPLRCELDAHNAFVPVKEVSITPIHFLYETTYMSNTYPLEQCIARCASNCSCSGFIYATASSFCLPFSDSVGLSNLSFVRVDSAEFSVYVKVQNSLSSGYENEGAQTTLPRANHLKSQIIKPLAFTVGAVIAAAMLLSLGILSVKRYRKHMLMQKYPVDVESDGEEEDLQGVLPMIPIRYSFKALYEATGGFQNLLGKGAHSRVYEGVLADGRRVAVKRLDQVLPRRKQFLTEVATVGGINHNNIVHLHGFCSQGSKRLLVYEYMENGSLDQWVFSKTPSRVLSWRSRFNIALGTARGLAYLHGDCMKPIIHFDVKPQNILLDKSFVPKVADFGLSKLVDREASFVMTGVRGTPGYLAPEWLSNSVVSKKCDVYSYGMVLFELLGGRPNVVQSLAGTNEWYLPTWAAIKCQEGQMLELVDKRLEGKFDEEQVKVIVHVAFVCIQKDPNMRPTMRTVCQMLEGRVPLPDETPYTSALLEEPLSPEADFSFASGSLLIEGR